MIPIALSLSLTDYWTETNPQILHDHVLLIASLPRPRSLGACELWRSRALRNLYGERRHVSDHVCYRETEKERGRDGSLILFKIKALRGTRAQRKKVCEHKIKNCQAKVRRENTEKFKHSANNNARQPDNDSALSRPHQAKTVCWQRLRQEVERQHSAAHMDRNSSNSRHHRLVIQSSMTNSFS